jgi:hypothetical protein
VTIVGGAPSGPCPDVGIGAALHVDIMDVAAKSTTIKTFEAEKDQKLSLNLNFANTGQSSSMSSPTRTIINLTDSEGNRIIYENNIGPSYSIQPIQIKNNGTVSVAITNQEDGPISVTMYLRQSGQPPSFGFDNGMVTFSNWLMIISAPVFGLGVWLFISEHRKKER